MARISPANFENSSLSRQLSPSLPLLPHQVPLFDGYTTAI